MIQNLKIEISYEADDEIDDEITGVYLETIKKEFNDLEEDIEFLKNLKEENHEF